MDDNRKILKDYYSSLVGKSFKMLCVFETYPELEFRRFARKLAFQLIGDNSYTKLMECGHRLLGILSQTDIPHEDIKSIALDITNTIDRVLSNWEAIYDEETYKNSFPDV